MQLLGSPLTWHLLSLAAGAVFLLEVTGGQWFFGDEWDFLADRSITIGDVGLFQPHNEHWSTTPILIYGLLYRVAGLGSYVPYVAVVLLAHLAVVHLMWRVMRRGGIEPWIATAFCAAFIPFGPGADNLLWAFQVGFVGSVAAGLGAILIADHAQASGRSVAAGWGVSGLALTFSGVSVPLIAASALAAWMRRGLKAFLLTASVPAAVYLLWLATAGRTGLGGGMLAAAGSVEAASAFLARSASAALSLGTPTVLAGILPLALTSGALVVRRRRGRKLPHAAIAAGIGEVLLLGIFAFGRASLGLDAADATRYVHIGGALLLPLMLIGLSDLARRRALGVLLVCALAVPWGVHNGQLLVLRAGNQAERERQIRSQIVAAGTVFDGRDLLRTLPDPRYSPNLDLGELSILLPELSTDGVSSHEAIIRAALALQVSITSKPEFDTTGSIVDIRGFDVVLRPGPPSCRNAIIAGPKPRLLVPVGAPSSLAITSGIEVEGELLLSAGGIRPDYEDRLYLPPADPVYLNIAVDEDLVGEASVIARLPGNVGICSVDGGPGEP